MVFRFIVVFLALFASNVLAEQEEKFEIHPVLTFAILEGFVAINAAMASAEPVVYGSVLALLSPLGASNKVSTTTNWVGIGSAASLGLYNAIELSGDRYSKQEIFIKNIYGWHALALISGITEFLTGEKIDTETLAVMPIKKGVVVALNYEF